MSAATFQQMIEAAEKEGISSWEPSEGPGEFRIADTNTGKTQKGDPKVGLRVAVDGGPNDGKSFWINYNFIASNPKGLAFTFRDLASLGATSDVVAKWDLGSAAFGEQVADALKGTTFKADVKKRENNGYTNIDLRNIKRSDAAAATAASESAPASDNPF